MNPLRSAILAAGLASLVAAQAPQIDISIGVRETGFAGGAFTAIGNNGGAVGGIEWINLDGQQLVLDGTWQQFTFDLAAGPVAGFAGASANGILEGAYGTLENIRIRNSAGVTEPITICIDDVADTITPTGGAPVTTVFGDFETWAQGTEVMFQEPNFSGSTSANIVAGGTSGVDNFVASRTNSYRVDFRFVDGTPTRWLRLTTFNATNSANPLVRFDDGSVITFWMRGGTAQQNAGSQGPGNAIAEMFGTGLNTGDTSTYYVARGEANALGAIAISLADQPDVSVLGGTLVSFGGFIVSEGVAVDSQGRLSLSLPGANAIADLVLQTVLLDTGTPLGLAFTNAVRARLGR
ncbi:MAG: hypothetical protein IPM29_30140 [Planctomycetes bacterium]|nr:hypothetical protein [Planctomycetota bacterium]